MKWPSFNLKSIRRKLCIILMIVLVSLIAGFVIININLRPLVLNMGEARLRSIAAEAINRAVGETIKGVTYEDLVDITCDDTGQVSYLQANAVRMNELATQTAIAAQQQIAAIELRPLKVPIGSILGGSLLAGRGPSISVKVELAGSVVSDFVSEFVSAGINQTRHKIYVRLHATMRILIPTGGKTVDVTTQVPITETIIIGQVPQSFINVEDTEDMLNLVPDISN